MFEHRQHANQLQIKLQLLADRGSGGVDMFKPLLEESLGAATHGSKYFNNFSSGNYGSSHRISSANHKKLN